MSAQPKSPQSSDEPTVVSADGTPLPEPTFEERAQVFWIENKKTILITCALVLLMLVAKELAIYYIDQRERAVGAEVAAAGNAAATLRSFTSAHADHQLAGLAWLALGDVAYKGGNYAEAVTAYDKAVPLTAATAFGGRALIGKACSQSQAGDKAKAEAAFKAIVADVMQSSATRGEARFHLAVLAIEAGRIEDARKLIDEVQATDLSGVWSERAGALRAGLPAAPVVAEAAAPAAEAGADLKLNLSGAK